MTNTENTPIEALDTHYPVRVDRYTLRRGVVARVGFRVARVSRGRSCSWRRRRFR